MDSAHVPQFRVKLASSEDELRAAQRLRYRVFVEELGGDGPLVDHDARLERDRFDEWFDHLLLMDDARGGDVIGVYRVLRDDRARCAGQFYSEDEYDLDILKRSGRRLMSWAAPASMPTTGAVRRCIISGRDWRAMSPSTG